MRILLAIAVTLSPIAFAAPNSEVIRSALEKQPACGTFVRHDADNLYLGFTQGMTVTSLSTQVMQRFSTRRTALDVATVGGHSFVLTPESIEEWDLASGTRVAEYDTYLRPGGFGNMEKARALARYGDKLIIAHGRLGLSVFNLQTKHISRQIPLMRQQLPLESMAQGVTVEGRHAFVVVDNYSLVAPPAKPAFRGIIVVDMESETVVAELDGMDPGVTSVSSDGDSLLASFGGNPIWKYELKSLLGSRTLPEPIQRVWRFGMKGHPSGAASIDDRYYFTCFVDGNFRRVPTALDRAALLL